MLAVLQALPAEVVHRVKAGESLWLIAKRAGVTVEALRQANDLETDVIWEGADLIIPTPAPVATPRSANPKAVPKPTPAPTRIVEASPRGSERFSPLPASPPATRDTRTRSALSSEGMAILQLQVTLDRAGFSPGKIDGYDGKFTRLAKTLCEAWNPAALRANRPATRVDQVPARWRDYVDSSLPGSGNSPDYKALTANKRTIHYYSVLELLAERFHCSETLLKKLNPEVNFQSPVAGTPLVVPNVVPFEIESYFNAQGQGVWSDLIGQGKSGRRIYISAPDSMLTLWEGETLIRAYPITLNEEDSPRGQREVGSITPGPTYSRKKTGLELSAGPNSPVGIVWCPLGNGFGIHGTSNPDSIGRSVSSGCVRLANWDAVRLAGLIRKGTQVFISERERSYRPE